MAQAIKLRIKSKRRNQIVISVDDDLHEKLAELAEANGLSMSTTGYEILNQTVDLVE